MRNNKGESFYKNKRRKKKFINLCMCVAPAFVTQLNYAHLFIFTSHIYVFETLKF